MIDIDKIRREVAIHHDIVLDKDDPTMIMATMVDVLLKQCVEEMNAQNEQYRKQMLNALQYSNEEAKATASKIIVESADYASKQIQEAVTLIIRAGLAKNQDALHEVHVARTTAVGAAIVSLLCAIVVGISNFWN